MTARRLTAATDFLRRLLATGCAALVLLLGVATSSPALHALAHGHDAEHAHGHALPGGAESADHCAIVLFGQGVSLAVESAAPAAPVALAEDPAFFAADELLLAAPRELHPPERGPPAV